MLNQPPDPSPRQLRVFLCHSSGDRPTVYNLYQRMKAYNVDPWLDKEKILPGQNWDFEIQRAVRTSDVVVVCLSNDFIVKEGYGQKEIKLALDTALEKPEGTIYVIPLKLEECELPEKLSPLQAVNYFEEDGFDKLIISLISRSKSIKEKIEQIGIKEQASGFIAEQLPPHPLLSHNPTLDQALLDLSLPENFFRDLYVVLKKSGLYVSVEEAGDKYTSIRRRYTRVRSERKEVRNLLYIPTWILDNVTPANVDAFSNIGSAFPKGSILIIFSNTNNYPARVIRKIMEVRWLDERQIKAFFVPWQDVEELKEIDAFGQNQWIMDQLKFEEL